MSVQRVTITAADEKFEPPTHEIDVSVVDGDVFLTVYEGSSDDLQHGRKEQFEVPPLRLIDLAAAINAGRQGQWQ